MRINTTPLLMMNPIRMEIQILLIIIENILIKIKNILALIVYVIIMTITFSQKVWKIGDKGIKNIYTSHSLHIFLRNTSFLYTLYNNSCDKRE